MSANQRLAEHLRVLEDLAQHFENEGNEEAAERMREKIRAEREASS